MFIIKNNGDFFFPSQEFMELIAKSNSMSTAELSQKKAELKLQQKVIVTEIFFF